MKSRFVLLATVFLLAMTDVAVQGSLEPALAGDLDDGISEFTEDSIRADDTLGQAETNINFIILEAVTEASQKKDKGSVMAGESGENLQYSVKCEAGADCSGPIYNINIQ